MRRDIPSNTDNVIDSRDVIARIDDLQDERDTLESALEDAQAAFDDGEDDPERPAMQDDVDAARTALAVWDEGEDGLELHALKALADEAEGYSPDWKHGTTLIAEDYFPEYCQQLLADIGDLPRNLPDYLVIDWDATAENLKADYTEVDFDGTAYLIR